MLKRYLERRNKDVISLLIFLQTAQYPQNNKLFTYFSKATIKNCASSFTSRLFVTNLPEESSETEHIDEGQTDLDEAISIYTTHNSFKNVDKSININKGLKLFEGTGEKTVHISKLLQSLLSIKPTSTDCERAFSINR